MAKSNDKKLSKNTIIALCFFAVFAVLAIISIIELFNTNIDTDLMKESMTSGMNAGSSLAENGTMGDTGLSSLLDLKSIIISIVRMTAFVCSIIFGAKALKEINREVLPGKPLALLSIIGPIVLFVIQSVITMSVTVNTMKETGIMDQFKCMEAVECVDNGNETSTCVIDGEEFECMNSLLDESQYEGYEEEDSE